MTRCQPGNLAEFVRSMSGNMGRRVVVLRAPESTRETRAAWVYGPEAGPLWVVQPLQPLRIAFVNRHLGELGHSMSMEIGIVPDAFLRPIGDECEDVGQATPIAAELAEGIAHE